MPVFVKSVKIILLRKLCVIQLKKRVFNFEILALQVHNTTSVAICIDSQKCPRPVWMVQPMMGGTGVPLLG